MGQYAATDVRHSPLAHHQEAWFPSWVSQAANEIPLKLRNGGTLEELLNQITDDYRSKLRENPDLKDVGHFGAPRSGSDFIGHTLWEPNADRDFVRLSQPERIEFEDLATSVAAALDQDFDDIYQVACVLENGAKIAGTKVNLKTGRVDYPTGDTAAQLLGDSLAKLKKVLSGQTAEPREQFNRALHAYHQAVPFERGSAGIAQVFFRGVHLAAFETLMAYPPTLDVFAQLQGMDDFLRWLKSVK